MPDQEQCTPCAVGPQEQADGDADDPDVGRDGPAVHGGDAGADVSRATAAAARGIHGIITGSTVLYHAGQAWGKAFGGVNQFNARFPRVLLFKSVEIDFSIKRPLIQNVLSVCQEVLSIVVRSFIVHL